MHRWTLFPQIKAEINCILIYRSGYVNQVTDPDKLPTISYCIKNSDSCYVTFSSSEARKLLKKEEISEKEEERLKSFFPAEVLEFILEKKFYKK
jgi:hypothetical protein